MVSMCCRCRVNEVEWVDDWKSPQCRRCNDRDIQRNQNRDEWNHFHPGEPCPEIELDK